MDLVHTIAGIPGMKSFVRKVTGTERRWRREYAELAGAQEGIRRRLAEKVSRGEAVNVLFVCHRPALWENLRSVYETLKADPFFHVQIVAIPQKSRKKLQGYRHEEYDSMGAEDFWEKDGCLRGYDYATGEWLDLKTLDPDYVFFQQPYNVMRPDAYGSTAISRYAKVLYMSYFPIINLDDTYDEATPLDFLKDLSFYFVQHEAEQARVEGRLEEAGPHVCRVPITGFPRFERIDEHREEECGIWNRKDSYRMIWTPRWTTNEGNCHFFDYQDLLLRYCEEHPETELVFRPHPQAFREWRTTGEMTEQQLADCRKAFTTGNRHLDESMNYYPVMYTSDVLITDRSTMFVDYLFTGKPIIYCASRGMHDEVIGGMEDAMYWVNSWEELLEILTRLRAGEDPLEKTRLELMERFRGTKGKKASERIRDVLKADAAGKRDGRGE